MLTTKKITVEAKTEIEGKAIAGHRVVIDGENIQFLPYQIDKAACKEHRAIVRADAADFEDYAYEMQENLLNAQGE